MVDAYEESQEFMDLEATKKAADAYSLLIYVKNERGLTNEDEIEPFTETKQELKTKKHENKRKSVKSSKLVKDDVIENNYKIFENLDFITQKEYNRISINVLRTK